MTKEELEGVVLAFGPSKVYDFLVNELAKVNLGMTVIRSL